MVNPPTIEPAVPADGPNHSDHGDPLGLYLHIPFCVKKCAYCDFYSVTDSSLRAPFTSALEKEMRLAAGGRRPQVDTIHLGGGTPSVLAAGQVTSLLNTARQCFHVLPEAEITVETNPESLTRPWLTALRKAGVNRLTIGVQSLDDAELAFLGRVHNATRARKAVKMAVDCGFANIGLDLIYGLPGQTRSGLAASLRQALALGPVHLSCYLLTREPGTPLAAAADRKEFTPLDDAAAGDLFDFSGQFLAKRGFARYEISNFSRRRHYRSRHNLKYWQRRPYLGLGPAAHSYDGGKRSANVGDLGEYLRRLETGRRPVATTERLTRTQQMTEAVYLGLRLAAGVDMAAFEKEFGLDFDVLLVDLPDWLRNRQLLEVTGRRCRLTPAGMRFHETVAAELVSGF